MVQSKQIDLSLVLYLHSLKLTLSHIEFLRYYQEDNQQYLPSKHKFKTDLQNLGYVWSEELTERGRELIQEYDNWNGVYVPKEPIPKKDNKVYNSQFIEWYDSFPSSDIFTYKDQTFKGTRSLKKDKDKCEVKYLETLREIPHETMLELLRISVETYMEKSLISGRNELSFFNNSLTYLNQGVWKRYVPLLGQQKKENFNSEIVI